MASAKNGNPIELTALDIGYGPRSARTSKRWEFVDRKCLKMSPGAYY